MTQSWTGGSRAPNPRPGKQSPSCPEREEALVLQAPCTGVPTRQVRDPREDPQAPPAPQPAGW